MDGRKDIWIDGMTRLLGRVADHVKIESFEIVVSPQQLRTKGLDKGRAGLRVRLSFECGISYQHSLEGVYLDTSEFSSWL